MKKYSIFITLTFVFCINNTLFAQNNNIEINAFLNTETNEIEIQQKTIYYNKSNSILSEVYFHNWANAYKNKKTPLAKRFIENYSKQFHFSKNKFRGNTDISTIQIGNEYINWEESKKNPDILKVHLLKPLKPRDSIEISTNYTVKLPKDKFTNYGYGDLNFHLKYWYLAPAIYTKKWEVYNNLDMDDLYMDFTNYNINFTIPSTYDLVTDLDQNKTENKLTTTYKLKGINKLDVELIITQYNNYIKYNSRSTRIISNLNQTDLNTNLKTDILNRELLFLEKYFGKLSTNRLLISNVEYEKNPVYGFSQLPSFIAPYKETFEWDIKMFKILSKKYIQNQFIFNPRSDYWLQDGMQTYLMMKYVETYYPDIKAIGDMSKVWGIRKLHLSKVDFNSKYSFVYQFAARKNIDQSLTTRSDSLSNFNRKIVNKYKAGLGIKYLEAYVGEQTIFNAIKKFTNKHKSSITKSDSFLDDIETEKDLSLYKIDFLNSTRKADYTIKKIIKKQDSIDVLIENKSNISVPIQLYGVKDNEIKFTQWLNGFDSIKRFSVPKNGFDKLSLNYESLLPEINMKNNWKHVGSKLFHRPLQLKFLKDIENPYYNQIFYIPVLRYNYYDGAVLGLAFSNKTILNKSFIYKLSPSYSTKSKTFSGSYSFIYENLPENRKVNKFRIGIGGSNYHYAQNLTYNSITPFASVEFKRKSLRDVSSKVLAASLISINKQKPKVLTNHEESYKYNVFNLGYGYSNPNIITDFRYGANFQIANNFSKVSLTARYRKLTNANRQFDVRFYAGAFLKNNTESNFFSFALDRPTDYLFQYDYLGRSETSGFFSQQIIINEGGFKSKLPVPFANQWLTTVNTSVGIWRWLELYGDVGLVKNRGENVYFAYDNGVRLNFIQDILEVYFPVYSNLGWEVSHPQYSSKIRFVLVLNPKKIFNFVKRGFY
ncbi:aminopeptidase [Lutibacter sp. TH_r2]|uniref:aminopeptidase n=1 Tax=Lutibacter sp. TH_r2 TaxID=3082083 RepID=UPI002954E852|nr:aminopeptidase [Lutibacter sp. TH_r2]MDV7187216.1 aminopeptidase [Lutibacter sp. TH_r2]